MDEYDLIQAALADLGTLHRRGMAQTLTEGEADELMRRTREHLLDLRDLLIIPPEPAIELTDAGRAYLTATPTRQDKRSLLSRIPGLKTGRQLVSPARIRGAVDRRPQLAAIDGGQS